MTIDEEKQQLRATIRRLSAQLPFLYRESADRAIARHLLALPEYRSAGAVFCFVSAGREIDTRPILEQTLADGKMLCVPLCVADGIMELRAIRNLEELFPGAYGILEPPADSPALSPDQIDLAVIHYPRISNFTDFDVFEQMPEVSVRYVTNVRELGTPDLIFLPGSKNSMGDLKWMRQNGLEAAVKRAAGKVPIFGICGGYQMLGCEIADPAGVEEGGQIRGMELLPVRTVLQKEKHRCQIDGKLEAVEGIFAGLTGYEFTGYEIHMGETVYCGEDGKRSTSCADDAMRNIKITETVVSDSTGCVYGSYIHGLFDKGEIAGHMIQTLAREKGIILEGGVWEDYRTIKERQYDQLADTLREYLYMEDIYGMLREAHIS